MSIYSVILVVLFRIFSKIAVKMITVERELDRVLTLLRNKIRERGFTQLEVQEALGWGRSYISQLLTKQKSLRIEQVLLILNVIGVDPSAFFSELYHFGDREGASGTFPMPYSSGHGLQGYDPGNSGSQAGALLEGNFDELRSLVQGLLKLLADKGILGLSEIDAATKAEGNR